YLAYSDLGGIHVKLLSTNEERLIARPAGVSAFAFWDVASWFPDGTQLLSNLTEPDGQSSIWAVSVLGQSPRKLRDDAFGFDVSPDAIKIAFAPHRAFPSQLHGFSSAAREIWVMGSQGENAEKVISVGQNESLTSAHWYPDGN